MSARVVRFGPRGGRGLAVLEAAQRSRNRPGVARGYPEGVFGRLKPRNARTFRREIGIGLEARWLSEVRVKRDIWLGELRKPAPGINSAPPESAGASDCDWFASVWQLSRGFDIANIDVTLTATGRWRARLIEALDRAAD